MLVYKQGNTKTINFIRTKIGKFRLNLRTKLLGTGIYDLFINYLILFIYLLFYFIFFFSSLTAMFTSASYLLIALFIFITFITSSLSYSTQQVVKIIQLVAVSK